MTNPGARTIALYWQNGRSLGHTSRTAKVARYLLRSAHPYSIAGITGAYRGLDLLPPEADVVKIPSFANFDDPDGWNLRPRLAMDTETLHQARADLITAFLRHYRPEVLMSDHIPRGTDERTRARASGPVRAARRPQPARRAAGRRAAGQGENGAQVLRPGRPRAVGAGPLLPVQRAHPPRGVRPR